MSRFSIRHDFDRRGVDRAPVEHAVEGNQVVFDALPQLAPKADTTYHVRVKALSPGDRRVSVQLLTNEMRTPVTKEESTHVLSDE